MNLAMRWDVLTNIHPSLSELPEARRIALKARKKHRLHLKSYRRLLVIFLRCCMELNLERSFA